MYLIPIGVLAGAGFDIGAFVHNLLWVTLGNIVSGAGGVALVYWTIYLRPDARGFAIPDLPKRLPTPPIAAGDSGR